MEYFVISAKFVPLKYYTLSSQLRRLTSFSVGLFKSANSVTRSYPVMRKSCIMRSTLSCIVKSHDIAWYYCMTQSLTYVHVHICFVIDSMAKILRFITRPTLIFNFIFILQSSFRAIINYLAKGGGGGEVEPWDKYTCCWAKAETNFSPFWL